MRRFYEGNDNKGYQEVVDKEAGLELIGFDLSRVKMRFMNQENMK